MEENHRQAIRYLLWAIGYKEPDGSVNEEGGDNAQQPQGDRTAGKHEGDGAG